jgi:hypothetical protein
VLKKAEAAEQGDEADEAGASDGASQLIPGVGRTAPSAIEAGVAWNNDMTNPV